MRGSTRKTKGVRKTTASRRNYQLALLLGVRRRCFAASLLISVIAKQPHCGGEFGSVEKRNYDFDALSKFAGVRNIRCSGVRKHRFAAALLVMVIGAEIISARGGVNDIKIAF